MSGLYTNRFRLEMTDVARLIFRDERIPIAEGLPTSVATVAEIVMTRHNLQQLHDLIERMLKPEADR